MADFLASLNLGGSTKAQPDSSQYNSVEDLQLYLRDELAAQVTPTRAAHVAIVMEMRPTTQFILPAHEGTNIDPSLGGRGDQSEAMGGEVSGESRTRVVTANDALMNQPLHSPTLQTAIVEHIMSALGDTDGSSWTIREVARASHGWNFTYVCRDSYQQWNRQHAKNPTKAVVGEYSLREPDPVLSNRPAFDCRGTIVVSFDRNSRSIAVKYNHMPFHKSVAELLQHFKPPPRIPGPGAPKEQKTPKTTDKKSRGPIRLAQEESGNPRKRKKKNNGVAQADPPAAEGETAHAPEARTMPSATVNSQPSDVGSLQQVLAFNHSTANQPQGPTGGEAPTAATQSGPEAATASSLLTINITPTEAARRREAATSMLSNAGVGPDTLSVEQFNIFANQAPELQKESLNMLVKYGAERLRIVHPNNRESLASTASSSPAQAQNGQSTEPTPQGPRTTKELAPQVGATSGNGDSTRAAENGPAAATGETGTLSKAKGRPKMGKSKTACFACKRRKVKCPKERPQCAECESFGEACEYAPPKPRKKKGADPDTSMADQEPGDDDDAPGDADEEQDVNEQPVGIEHQTYGIDPGVSGQGAYRQGEAHHNSGHAAEPPVQLQAAAGGDIDSRPWGSIGPSASSHGYVPPEPVPVDSHAVSNPSQAMEWTPNSQSSAIPQPTALDPTPHHSSYRRGVGQADKDVSAGGTRGQDRTARQTAGMPSAQTQPLRHSPTVVAALMAASQTSQMQRNVVSRAASRQGRPQTRTPGTDQATRGYRPPPNQNTAQSTTHYSPYQGNTGSGHGQYGSDSNQVADYGSTPGRNSQSPHGNAGAAGSRSREQSHQQAAATSGYQTDNTGGTWKGTRSQGRSEDSRAYVGYDDQNAYSQQQPALSKPAAANRQDLGSRPLSRERNVHGHGQQSYSYPPPPQIDHQQQQQQQQQQQHGWYNVGAHSATQPYSQPAEYAWKMQDSSWSGV